MESIRAEWDRGEGCNPQFGVVVLEDDPVSVPTLQRLLDPMGIEVQPARIGFPIEGDGTAALAERLRAAAATIPPSAAPAAIGFACTTGAIRLGSTAMVSALARRDATIHAVTPIDGAIAALRTLGARRVAIVSPYGEATSREVARHIQSLGFEVSRLVWFGAGNTDIAAISSDSIRAAALEACASGRPDALFLSCTGMRATPLVAELEARLGIAVLTSLQVMAWSAAGVLGVPPQGPGRLFSIDPPLSS